MRKLLYLLFLIILIELVNAQDEYTKSEYVDMNIEVFADLNLTSSGKKLDIDYLEADLFFYPRNAKGQKILKEKIDVVPNAVVKENKDALNIRWNNFNDKHSYKINKDVRVFNDFIKLDKEIKFPISGVDSEFDEYLKHEGFIDVNDDIRKKARELVKDEDDLDEAVFKIADWTRKNIEYDLSTLTADVVQPSSWVMKNRIGVCDEVTNLFVSMLRAVNIPVRYVSGVVYSNLDNNWGAHAWAEVYFPGYGWVPYDIIYGQYGWLDPSHIKLQEGKGSGEASVSYTWRARGVNVESPEGLSIKVKETNKGKELEPIVKLDVHVLKNSVKAGSYVPIQVDVENLKDYTVIPLVFISSSPKVIGERDKNIFLKPREKKSLFWILKLDDEAEDGFLYKVGVETKELSGGRAYSEIEYANDLNRYELEDAKSRLKILEEKAEIESDVDFNCGSDKFSYYEDEVSTVICSVENDGDSSIKVNVCIDKCKEVILEAGEKEAVDFFISLGKINAKEIVARVEGENILSYDFLGLEVLKVPRVEIMDLSYPESVKATDKGEIKFKLDAEKLVNNVKVSITNLGSLSLDSVEGKVDVALPYKGWKLRDGNLKIKVEYYDAKGRRFEKIEEFYINVERVDLFKRIFYNLVNSS